MEHIYYSLAVFLERGVLLSSSGIFETIINTDLRILSVNNTFVRKGYNSTSVIEKNGVIWIEHNNLKKLSGVKHAYSTRIGGVSTGACASMNFRNCELDSNENTKRNMEIFCSAAGFDINKIVATHQTHTINVEIVTKDDVPKGAMFDSQYSDVDGLVTNVAGAVLVASSADCILLYFYDPVKKAVGICHAGWKGTLGKIGKVTVDKMIAAYGSNPQDIIAAVGPGICADCYEVSTELRDEFIKTWDIETVREIFTDGREGHFQLDLWKANECVLLQAGIKKENISITDICTKCNCDKLFSHRVQGNMRGNQCGFIMCE